MALSPVIHPNNCLAPAAAKPIGEYFIEFFINPPIPLPPDATLKSFPMPLPIPLNILFLKLITAFIPLYIVCELTKPNVNPDNADAPAALALSAIVKSFSALPVIDAAFFHPSTASNAAIPTVAIALIPGIAFNAPAPILNAVFPAIFVAPFVTAFVATFPAIFAPPLAAVFPAPFITAFLVNFLLLLSNRSLTPFPNFPSLPPTPPNNLPNKLLIKFAIGPNIFVNAPLKNPNIFPPNFPIKLPIGLSILLNTPLNTFTNFGSTFLTIPPIHLNAFPIPFPKKLKPFHKTPPTHFKSFPRSFTKTFVNHQSAFPTALITDIVTFHNAFKIPLPRNFVTAHKPTNAEPINHPQTLCPSFIFGIPVDFGIGLSFCCFKLILNLLLFSEPNFC